MKKKILKDFFVQLANREGEASSFLSCQIAECEFPVYDRCSLVLYGFNSAILHHYIQRTLYCVAQFIIIYIERKKYIIKNIILK